MEKLPSRNPLAASDRNESTGDEGGGKENEPDDGHAKTPANAKVLNLRAWALQPLPLAPELVEGNVATLCGAVIAPMELVAWGHETQR